MTKEKEPISRLMLERYLCGEGTLQERKHIEHTMRNNHEVDQTVTMLRTSNGEILAAYPAAEMIGEIEQKLRTREIEDRLSTSFNNQVTGHPWRSPLQVVFAMILLSVISLPVILVYLNGRIDTERVKGQVPYLTVYRQMGNDYETLSDGSIVFAKDRIQLGYVAAGKKYGFIFSVDGNGNVTIHYPETTSHRASKAQLESGREHLLTTSFELDDAPSFERFFFLTSDDTINIGNVVTECERQFDPIVFRNTNRCIPLSGQYQQMSITLVKEKR